MRDSEKSPTEPSDLVNVCIGIDNSSSYAVSRPAEQQYNVRLCSVGLCMASFLCTAYKRLELVDNTENYTPIEYLTNVVRNLQT